MQGSAYYEGLRRNLREVWDKEYDRVQNRQSGNLPTELVAGAEPPSVYQKADAPAWGGGKLLMGGSVNFMDELKKSLDEMKLTEPLQDGTKADEGAEPAEGVEMSPGAYARTRSM